MNIIEQQREDIITENNSAQESLIHILETGNRTTQLLRIRESVYGDLDFSILPEYGYENVTHIIIEKGGITSITGLPKSLVSFICPANLIIELTNLPIHLNHIDVRNNYIKSISLGNLVQLETINLSHNKLKSLENLPKTIKELICDHNILPKLDLRGMDSISKLIVSNNPITLIENLPEGGIYDLQMTNCPSVEFRNSPNISLDDNTEIIDEHNRKKDYNEALHYYFKIKKDYEDKLHEQRKKVFQNEPNKKIAKRLLQGIRPKCINCKQDGGTIFSQGKVEERYTAKCGNQATPCKLDISIYAGASTNIEDTMVLFKEEVDDIKDTIIRQKLDTLFNYVTEDKSIDLFKKQMQAFNENMELYNRFLNEYNDIHNNKEKQTAIREKTVDIYRMIEQNRELINRYVVEGNQEILVAAVTEQLKEILPEIRKLTSMKYEVMEVIDKKDFIHYKYPVNINRLNTIVGEKPRVIKVYR
uniref:Leucine-rich repeat domain-containing protein n=1 Tax=viral metagenome TaxID=1070528 RepID=A0A6C0D5W5_9ZZZZ